MRSPKMTPIRAVTPKNPRCRNDPVTLKRTKHRFYSDILSPVRQRQVMTDYAPSWLSTMKSWKPLKSQRVGPQTGALRTNTTPPESPRGPKNVAPKKSVPIDARASYLQGWVQIWSKSFLFCHVFTHSSHPVYIHTLHRFFLPACEWSESQDFPQPCGFKHTAFEAHKGSLLAWLRSESDYRSTLPDWITFVRAQLLTLRMTSFFLDLQQHNRLWAFQGT